MDIVNLAFTCLYGGGSEHAVSQAREPTSVCLVPDSKLPPQTNNPVAVDSRNSLYAIKQCHSCKIPLDSNASWYCANDQFYCSERCRSHRIFFE